MNKFLKLLFVFLFFIGFSYGVEFINFPDIALVNDIEIDNDTAWIATDNNLLKCKLDGSLIEKYSSESSIYFSSIKCIELDVNGYLWLGTLNGLACLDGLNVKFYTESDGLIFNWINDIAFDSQGQAWIGTEKGLSSFDGNTWTSYDTSNGLPHIGVKAVAIENDGTKWFGTYWGVSKFNNGVWTTYTVLDGLRYNDVNVVKIDNNSNLWFGCDVGGASVYDGTTWTNYSEEDGLGSSLRTSSIEADSTGNIWFGSDGGGLSKYDGSTWITYKESDGLVNNHVRAISIDKYGNVWVGTWQGVSVLKNKTNAIHCKPSGNIAINKELHQTIKIYKLNGQLVSSKQFNKEKNATFNREIGSGIFLVSIYTPIDKNGNKTTIIKTIYK